MVLSFCKVWVELLHDIIEPINDVNATPVADEINTINFTNEEVDIEFEVVDNIDSESDSFKMTIWNLPIDTEIVADDYLKYQFWWDNDSTAKSPIILVQITSVDVEKDGVDVKWTIEGIRYENYLFTSAVVDNTKYSNINSLLDLQDLLSEYGFYDIISQIDGINMNTEFTTPILTRDKKAFQLVDEVRAMLASDTGLPIRTQLQNKQSIIFYSYLNELIPDDIKVYEFDIDDCFVYKASPTKTEGRLYYIYFEVYGAPNIIAGQLVMIDNELYKVQEVTHDVSIGAGYNMKILGYRSIPIATEE